MQTKDFNFFAELYSSPETKRSEPTTLDRLINSLGSENKSIELALKMIKELQEEEMDDALLREFVNKAQTLHPAISDKIQEDIESYPLFKPISERIGSLYSILSPTTSIDQFKWFENKPTEFKSANILKRAAQFKMYGSMVDMVTNSEGFLNVLFLRNSPRDNMAYAHESYVNESALSHGFSGAMDVFHCKRADDAREGVKAIAEGYLEQQKKLLNTYTPILNSTKHENKYHDIKIEKIEAEVNAFGRPAKKDVLARGANESPEYMKIHVPLGKKEKHFDGGRDNERSATEK